jgi:hypothetical protein
MADLLESSAKHLNNNCSDNNSSNNSTPRLSKQFQPLHFQSINNNGQNVQQQTINQSQQSAQQLMNLQSQPPQQSQQQMNIPIEAMDTSKL